MSTLLSAVPLVVLGSLQVWAFIDLVSASHTRESIPLGLLWAAGAVFLAVGDISRWRWTRWVGLPALVGAYLGLHAFVLGVQLLPALGFVTLLIVQVELRILADRFGPLFASTMTDVESRRIEGALVRTLVRLALASSLSIALPLAAANLSAAGFVPATTIPSAFLLAASLVAVVALLALFPTSERRTP